MDAWLARQLPQIGGLPDFQRFCQELPRAELAALPAPSTLVFKDSDYEVRVFSVDWRWCERATGPWRLGYCQPGGWFAQGPQSDRVFLRPARGLAVLRALGAIPVEAWRPSMGVDGQEGRTANEKVVVEAEVMRPVHDLMR